MRIAYFGGDWFIGCLDVLQSHGHNISHVFTHGEASYNQRIRQWALDNNIPCYHEQPKTETMSQLQAAGVDCLFCNEYPWLIPVEDQPFKTLNIHPSMLPEGRGPTPLSWAIMRYPEHAGVSFHKLAKQFDTGDIIFQEAINLDPSETLNSLLGRLELMIPLMLDHLCRNFDALYDNATVQSGGSYWPKITLNDRKINWQSDVVTIRRQVAASGQFGVIAAIDRALYLVTEVDCVEMPHKLSPGTLYQEDVQKFCIAISNGICVISKASIIEKAPLNND